MKSILVIAFILKILICDNTVYGADTNSSSTPPQEEYYNPHEDEHRLILWKNLFLKVNTLLVETQKLNSNIADMRTHIADIKTQIADMKTHNADVNQKIDDLTKIQQQQGIEIKQIMNHYQGMHNNLSKWTVEASNGSSPLSNSTSNSQLNWTTILRRMDGSVDFYRNWTEYKTGFGNPPDGEFFIGLEKLHQLTTATENIELKIILRDWEGEERYALYDGFQIADEGQNYKITILGDYSGDAGDAMAYHKGKQFSAKDKDNDNDNGSCAQWFKGAWWFDRCYHSHLTGPYKQKKEANNKGIVWKTWKTHEYSLKYAEMLIRPKVKN
ncbi:ficolin-2-like [Musca domestica]|uniref:Ficolin-2-like n=1 Tax=Musca domestica TaxID=7370 RepID=A0A1I8M1I7_MUSDO|nr:ficolin-2-like [Musca domestica]